MKSFRNEPLLELRRSSQRDRLTSALARLDTELPLDVPVIIGGERRFSDQLTSVDPGQPERIVARSSAATEAEVDAAVSTAAGSTAWRESGAWERARTLARAAGIMRGDRYRLAALAVRECGKPWAEADADVCEAIDFIEYYAQSAMVLEAGPDLLQLPGERNWMSYRPRGVVAVISPWNFPLAIATGMTVAALATGNAVCLKPAEQSPACALAIVEALQEAGVPTEAVSLLPGEGDVGAALVRHPGVHTIAFTGSEAVGLEIIGTAAHPAPGQRHLKRVVSEMGGKNCVIVDADADLDEVVPQVLASAFGFAGQKCSAASRVLVHERVAKQIEKRLREALPTLRVGQAEDFGTDVPPVIDGESMARIGEILSSVESGATVSRAGEVPPGGYFVAPTIVAGALPESPVVTDEIFGPVLSVESVSGVEEACEIIEAQRQALTGGLFSRNPRTIADVISRLSVGNLYINRGTTGAMVGRQPFGGNRMSGTGTKAGGPDYLHHFVEPVAITENTVRHGLAL